MMKLIFEDNKHSKRLIYSFLAALLAGIIVITSCGSSNFKISNLAITPAEALSGEVITISVDVTNNGGIEASYQAILFLDGEERLSQEVILGPSGATETVEFILRVDAPGEYPLEVGGLKGTVQVIDIDEIINQVIQAMTELESFHFDIIMEFEIPMSEEINFDNSTESGNS